MTKSTRIKHTRADRIFDAIVYSVLSLLLLIVIYPLWFVIIASVSDPSEVAFGHVILWPEGFSLEGYQQVIGYSKIWRSYLNTIGYTICDVLLTVTITVMAGYALSRRNLVGKSGFVIYMMITMFFSGGLIPTYLTVKSLGLANNPAIVFLLGLRGRAQYHHCAHLYPEQYPGVPGGSRFPGWVQPYALFNPDCPAAVPAGGVGHCAVHCGGTVEQLVQRHDLPPG